MAKEKKNKDTVEALYSLDGKINLLKAFPFGLQHILAMFVANITPIIIVAAACGLGAKDTAMIIQSAMIIAGIGTFIQLFPIWRIGSRLPIVMGISFTFVSLACTLGAQYGYGTLMGAVLIGGIVEGLLGLFAKYWIKVISPIVAATVVTAIGFSLLSVGAASFGGGTGAADFGSANNWILGIVTLVSCILFNILAKGYLKQLSVLFGLVVGYIVALCMGMVDFSALHDVDIIALPHFMPFKIEFNANAIFSFILIFLVSATETIGDTSALASSGLGRDVTEKETSGSIACDGFVSALSSIFGCMPITSFSQNVGLVAMTKVVNRYAISTGAIIMVVAGFFPADCCDRGKSVRFGYIELEEKKGCFLPGKERIRGHEFHYFDSEENGKDCIAIKPVTGKNYPCIHASESCFAGFPHLYYPSNPRFAENFVRKCEKYSERMKGSR